MAMRTPRGAGDWAAQTARELFYNLQLKTVCITTSYRDQLVPKPLVKAALQRQLAKTKTNPCHLRDGVRHMFPCSAAPVGP